MNICTLTASVDTDTFTYYLIDFYSKSSFFILLMSFDVIANFKFAQFKLTIYIYFDIFST